MSYDCDLEQPVGYQEITRKARKPHKCGDCKGVIQPKEFYIDISGIWNREPASFKRCTDCKHIRCEIVRETQDACMAINHLRSWLMDYGYVDPAETTHPWHRWVGMFNAVAAMRGGKRIEVEPAVLTPSP